MQLPNRTLIDIPRKERARMETLLMERAFMGYSLSWKKLYKALVTITGDEDQAKALLEASVLAYNDDEEKEIKKALNEQIDSLMESSGMLVEGKTTMEHVDPFGRHILCMRFPATAPAQFSKSRCVELGTTKYKIPVDKLTSLLAESYTPGKEYVQVQIRAVAAGKEKE